MNSIKVLTVCLGNICRSPAAQGILESVAATNRKIHLEVDSAGTAAYHIGKSPDPRSIKALADVGIDISGQQARQVTAEDFERFDWILVMDKENLANLQRIQPPGSRANLVLFGRFSEAANFGEVDDPYYGKDNGFVTMRAQLQTIAEHFVEHLTLSKQGSRH